MENGGAYSSDPDTQMDHFNPSGGAAAGGGGKDLSGKLELAEKRVVVVMGATGAGKSRLAIDLASHLPRPIEIVNADSMQIYHGLDVLTNKVAFSDRKGVPHHLLGTVDSSVEFTSKDFRDLAVPIIDEILARNCLPVIVGGSNYYIQALVSPFLVDDVVDDMADCSLDAARDFGRVDPTNSYERLKEVDPVAANRIHPNDHRKIKRYLSLYESLGALPSNMFQGKAAEKWGRAVNLRYNCCFIWVDASIPVLDKFVEQRVDSMIDAGLLNEVHDIYKPNADYTRGLQQAIGVREFEWFFSAYFENTRAVNQQLEQNRDCNVTAGIPKSIHDADEVLQPDFSEILTSEKNKLNIVLYEAIDKLKANTRKLVRRQKRRLNRLKIYFGWDLHHLDATEAFLCNSEDLWQERVVQPCVDIVRAFLVEEAKTLLDKEDPSNDPSESMLSRDLWTQHKCEACGNQILRGAHEWEQHKQGRGHRKRLLRLRKKHLSSYTGS